MRGLYIHIPFCNSICSYCDFCKFLHNDKWANDYLEALSNEIDEYYEGDEVKSIYIGGGTPSVLSEKNLNKLFSLLNKIKKIKNFEFTFECNVNDINEKLLEILIRAGVNRLSVGVQSFNKYNLKYLNRKHTKKEIVYNIELAKKYFDNINVDLIYAIPIETMFMFKDDVKSILKLDVDHISTYSLIIEDRTMLSIKKVKPIDEELDLKMYKYLCKKFKKYGYNHYEVSNFSRNGKSSIHNLNYWDNEEYYGFGLGAHGYINDMRYENTRNFNKYLNNEYRFNEVLISNREEMENEIMLGLRKLNGISISAFKKKFDKDIFEEFNIKYAIDKGLLIQDDDAVFIPEDKIYIMNEIINMII